MRLDESMQRICYLVKILNQYRHEYYNLNNPSVSDAVYDRLELELKGLEAAAGFVLSNSPTQTVGAKVIGDLKKVVHNPPLLSLDNIHKFDEVRDFVHGNEVMAMTKIDGLTVEIDYIGGHLALMSTRGDGLEGSDITFNASAFENLPLQIGYQGYLKLVGEAHIRHRDFERYNEYLQSQGLELKKNPRNLAAGTATCHDPAKAIGRGLRFRAFRVKEGLDEPIYSNKGKSGKLLYLQGFGIEICPYKLIRTDEALTDDTLQQIHNDLLDLAKKSDIPIDGIVYDYNNIDYSNTLENTNKSYGDSIAFKFPEKFYETVFRNIEWTPSRNGMLSPVGLFDPVIIDGTEVKRATLFHLSYIENLELVPGCRIKVSKRDKIIP